MGRNQDGKYVLFSAMKGDSDSLGLRIAQPFSLAERVHATTSPYRNVPKANPKSFRRVPMRKLIILLLAFAITACGAAPVTPTEAPTQEVIQPTQTAAVVIQTVVVTVVPTDMPTQVPTATPLPTQTEVPPTATQPPAPTDTAPAAAAPTQQAPASTNGLVAVDNTLGAGYFTDMTRTRSDFSLRCQANKEITFSVKPTDSHVTSVDFYYRIEDRGTGAILDWKNAGRMVPDGKGNFVVTFSGEKINPDLRKANAWFDYQFIGSSNSGVVGRSEKIVQQVSFTLDCP
jgi:hypothetical protein